MTLSLCMVMLIPVFVFIWVYGLAYYYRDFRRRLAYGEKEVIPRIDPAERPALVLKYNNASQKAKAWMCAITSLLMCLFCFFLAGKSARHDMEHIIFSRSVKKKHIPSTIGPGDLI